MELVVISPEGTRLTETVTCVTLPGSMGSFSVLKNHAPLIATLEKGEVIYIVDKKVKSFEIEGGVVSVEKNVVKVLIEYLNL